MRNGEITNKLKILSFRFEKEGLSWIKCSVEGPPPLPRYGHSMVHYKKEKMIVVAGGYYKCQKGITKSHNPHDFKILSLERLEWLNPIIQESAWTFRFGHAATILNDQTMFIFGGRTEVSQFPNFGIQKIQLSTYLIKNCIHSYHFFFLRIHHRNRSSCQRGK